MDRSPPGSPVHGILQARILEWVPPGDLPKPGIKPESVIYPALAGGFFMLTPPGKPINQLYFNNIHFKKRIRDVKKYS